MALTYTTKLGNRLRQAKLNPGNTYNIDSEPDAAIRRIMLAIYRQYGHVVEDKGKLLTKYGLSRQVQSNTKTLLMTNKTGVFTETLPTGNTIDKVSCTAAYTGTFRLEYHTIDGFGNFTFGVQTVTVTDGAGTLAVPCARVSRAESFNTPLTGDLYILASKIFAAGGWCGGSVWRWWFSRLQETIKRIYNR